jgi:hypothetical protein
MNRRPPAPGRLPLLVGLALGLSALGLAQAPAGPTTAGPAGPQVRLPGLVPDPAQIAAASPQLLARLRDDSFNYFRFLNRPWAERVCQAFANDLRSVPATSLHGDAHVEQYAFTSTARGLDDFDDSARGPMVVDLVRFLGSIELSARARGWSPEIDALADGFLDGYRKGLADSEYLPPDPAVVGRLRPLRSRDPKVFMAFAESVMFPFTRADRKAIDASLVRLERLLRGVNPALPARYLRVKKGGWVRIGVGSALTPKVLLRVEGPGPSPGDDLIVEGKQLSDLRGVSCLEIPKTAEALRVISGTEQIGRLRHDVLAVVPALPGSTPGPDWWVRSWDSSYAEVTVQDYDSVREFAEVVFDAGVQLGAGAVLVATPGAQAQARQLAQDTLARLAPKARTVAHELTEEMLEAWTAFKAGAARPVHPPDSAGPDRRVP